MCRHAVDRSQGGLVEIYISHFGTNDLLNYIADRSSSLRSLGLALCGGITDKGLAEAVVKLPFLEDIDVSYYAITGMSLREIGLCCPNLKTLKLLRIPKFGYLIDESNDIAIKIAESMPKLRHLQLFKSGLNNTGFHAILDGFLDGCLQLEHLDLRKCLNIDLDGDLEKRCSERVRVLRRPYDSTDDIPLQTEFEWEELEYLFCAADVDVDLFRCTSPSPGDYDDFDQWRI